ncbi:MAG: aminopeptidase [Deltaproteobacteria bacterium]|nr:aminopeptidase [Deltaproteobacteria bacterium]
MFTAECDPAFEDNLLSLMFNAQCAASVCAIGECVCHVYYSILMYLRVEFVLPILWYCFDMFASVNGLSAQGRVPMYGITLCEVTSQQLRFQALQPRTGHDMKDPRIDELAKTLVNHSCQVKPNDLVMIEFRESGALPLVEACVKEVTRLGGVPMPHMQSTKTMRSFYVNADESQYRAYGGLLRGLIEKIDCYIGILGGGNPFELSDLTAERKLYHSKFIWKYVHLDVRLHKRWVVVRFPTSTLSLKVGMPTDTFEELYYKVCNFDYSYLTSAIGDLATLLRKTRNVRILGEGTDLRFSVENMPVVSCTGQNNIPDGELYTAPVPGSMHGDFLCNLPTLHNGVRFEGVRLSFEGGRVVRASSETFQDQLHVVLDTDEGARHVCEFALGLNPFIQKSFMDPIFDEKMYGSFHLALGNAFLDADNGNRSMIHWDLISSQLTKDGGGEIYFDDVLIRKDGHFVHPLLKDSLSWDKLTGLDPSS